MGGYDPATPPVMDLGMSGPQGMGAPPPGGFGPPMPQPKKSNNGLLIVGAVIGVVLLLGLGTVLVLNLVGDEETPSGQQSADPAEWDPDAPIEGVTDFYADGAPWVEDADHVNGKVEYPTAPPAAGSHNVAWSTCNGVVYEQKIPNEHAVHSLEHGAVWFTYSPDLPQSEISTLAGKVNGIDYTFMSPYPGQDAPIILTAWGYQLKVDSADDERITAFTAKYRVTASREPGATCNGGTAITGDTPMTSIPGKQG